MFYNSGDHIFFFFGNIGSQKGVRGEGESGTWEVFPNNPVFLDLAPYCVSYDHIFDLLGAYGGSGGAL